MRWGDDQAPTASTRKTCGTAVVIERSGAHSYVRRLQRGRLRMFQMEPSRGYEEEVRPSQDKGTFNRQE